MWGALVVLPVGAAFLAMSAAAAVRVEPGTYPVSELPMLAQQYAPGVALPTKFPVGIAQFRLGPGRLDGYRPRAKYELDFEKNSNSLLGFRLDVFSGSRVAAVTSGVRAYLRRGGWVVTTSPFTAGQYRGMLETQKNGGTSFQMYTWTSEGSTYVLTTYVRYAGKPQNGWSKKSVIASFKLPAPASP
ncbi:MAG: hypothetical protein QOK13_2020 [Gaiellaceae bacterium]|nr:hypothetical protein [Gaiellaceae bacterium]